MLKPRLPVARPLALCLWLGSIAAVGILGLPGARHVPAHAWRRPGTGGTAHRRRRHTCRHRAARIGVGRHDSARAAAAMGAGGRIGTGGRRQRGDDRLGGIDRHRRRADGGAEMPATDGRRRHGRLIVVVDAQQRLGGGVAQRGACDSVLCATTPVIYSSSRRGHDFNSPATAAPASCVSRHRPIGGRGASAAISSPWAAIATQINGVLNALCGLNLAPAAVSGGYCFQITPGVPNYAALAVF